MQKNNPKIINAWCMYDWANSVYSLVISTAIFPAYYSAFAVGEDGSDIISFYGYEMINTVVYSYALSSSFLFVALIVPLLSGIADYTGRKLLFMKIFVYTGAASCAGLYFFEGTNVELGIVGAVLANIGFSGSLVFYDAFLPEIATEDRFDKVSARGYSLGYLGSVILLLFNIFSIEFYEFFGLASAKQAMKLSFLLVGLWWVLFSLIPFKILPTKIGRKQENENYLLSGYKELMQVFRQIKRIPDIKIFLASFFFYNTGVQTVILLATTFAAKVLGMEMGSLIIVILIIQIVAIIGATMFAALSGRIGNKKSIQIMIVIWMIICIGAYFVTNSMQFYIVSFLVGMVLGGIQSLSRATYSKLIPPSTLDHASFFSFYDSAYYVSVVMGTFSYGLVEQLTENLRYNALLLGVYFLIALVILSFLKFKFKLNYKS